CSLIVWAIPHWALPFFLGSVSLFLVLLAGGMWNLTFPPAETSKARLPAWREGLASPTIWLFGAVFFFYSGAETAVGGWIGSYVSRLGPRGTEIASLVPAFFWAALTLGRGMGSFLLARVPEYHVLRTGFGTAAVGIFLMLSSP